MIDRFDGDYAFLSNFYPSSIFDSNDGFTYPTVEHFFQAKKSLILREREMISKAETPGRAKRMGRKVQLRSDWEDIKLFVMEYALRRKFSKPRFKEALLATGDEELIEGNWWGDTFWGVCNGVGENNLGKLLMKIREEFKNERSVF